MVYRTAEKGFVTKPMAAPAAAPAEPPAAADPDFEAAVAKLQAVQRGHAAKGQVKEMRMKDRAAAKIQALERGKEVRKRRASDVSRAKWAAAHLGDSHEGDVHMEQFGAPP